MKAHRGRSSRASCNSRFPMACRQVQQQAQHAHAEAAQKIQAQQVQTPGQKCCCACTCGKKDSPPTLFVDEEFPARWNILYNPSVVAAWLRPHEIRAEPRLFVEEASRFDVQQGCLGDAWFIAACAAVAERPELLRQLVPDGQVLHGPGYDGSVTFRLWHLGEWKEIRVDDRIPVDANGQPVYARCHHKDEFWLPLLEKAYAKFHGSYRYLDTRYGDTLSEGLINLTGYCLDVFSVDRWEPEDSFNLLKGSSDDGAMILCRTENSAPGLPGCHVYTVTKVFHSPTDKEKGKDGKEGKDDMRMVRVRNPWGTSVEWTGAWKDGDERWNKVSSEIKEAMEYKPEEDGEFWMDAKDFCDNFTSVCFATEKPMEAMRMKVVGQATGHWSDDLESGGTPDNIERFSKNPQFLLLALGAMDPEDDKKEKEKKKTKKENGEKSEEEDEEPFNPMAGMEAVVELLQEHNRKKNTWPHQISYYIFETCTERRLTAEQMLQITYVTGATDLRDEDGVRSTVRLQPGRRYVIVPTTKDTGCEGDFLLRVFSRRARVRLSELPA